MEDRIRELFAALLQVRPEEINDATDPDSVERWDSMQHLMLVSGFEEEFGVDVEPEEAADMYSDFSTFKRIVLEKLNAARP
ncbi:MAG TPA: acyl carrier protein [Vicinamibacterales bacterium]|nr:acyl carrier protein [Vicinamibacterales bacterium]